MLGELTHSDFAERLHETFRIDLGSSVLELKLVAVDILGKAPEEGRRVPFSAVFRGADEPILPQQIYPLEHPEMGRLEVFLVPIGPDNEGQRYELVFT
jgi:hypothetical protein